jgi:hypothetical protein
VTQWGPTVMTDMPPQRRFSGLRRWVFGVKWFDLLSGRYFRKA